MAIINRISGIKINDIAYNSKPSNYDLCKNEFILFKSFFFSIQILLSERMNNIVQLWKTVKVDNNLVAIFNSSD